MRIKDSFPMRHMGQVHRASQTYLPCLCRQAGGRQDYGMTARTDYKNFVISELYEVLRRNL